MKAHYLPIAVAFVFSIASCKKNEPPAAGKEVPAQPALSKHEVIANKIMDAMQEFGTAMASATDLHTANEAATKITEIGERFGVLAAELKKMEPPSEEVKKAIDAKMEARNKEMEKVMGEQLEKTMQALRPNAREVLQKALVGFFLKMGEAGQEFSRHFEVKDEQTETP